MKKCTRCGSEKTLESFAKSKKYGLQPWCRDCQKSVHKEYYQRDKARFLAYNKKQKEALQEKVVEYLRARGCVDCGLIDPLVLEFDHIDPTTKVKSISALMQNGRCWSSILPEIEKCAVRCCNCHRRRTIHQFGWYRSFVDITT